MIYITSLSNASLQSFPQNSLSKFTHLLPQVITFSLEKQYFIAIKSVAIDYNLKNPNDATKIGFIKINLHELQPKTSPILNDEQCLARIPIDTFENKNNSFVYWYEFQNPLFISLTKRTSLKELNFELTDENNNQLQLKTGTPTIINISIEEMNKEHFSITSSHSLSKSQFLTNSPANFHVALPSEITLSEEWEVALHSVIIPKGIYITQELTMELLKKDGTIEKTLSWFWDKDIPTVNTMESALKKWGFHLATNVINSKKKKYSLVKHTSRMKKSFQGYLNMNEMLCRTLGIKGFNGNGRKFDIPKIGVKIPLFTSDGKNLGTHIDHVSIYCDIVHPSMIGNTIGPILETVSTHKLALHEKDSDTVFHIPHLTFRPVAKNSFKSLHFEMYTLDGSIIPFKKSDDNNIGISFVLLFRKK